LSVTAANALKRDQKETKTPSVKKLFDWRFLVSPNHKKPRIKTLIPQETREKAKINIFSTIFP
jgi:hypothetical protein